jgi:hypothetical protein
VALVIGVVSFTPAFGLGLALTPWVLIASLLIYRRSAPAQSATA